MAIQKHTDKATMRFFSEPLNVDTRSRNLPKEKRTPLDPSRHAGHTHGGEEVTGSIESETKVATADLTSHPVLEAYASSNNEQRLLESTIAHQQLLRSKEPQMVLVGRRIRSLFLNVWCTMFCRDVEVGSELERTYQLRYQRSAQHISRKLLKVGLLPCRYRL
ncbi:MAG: hypothetical protein K2X93_18685 [Candidatus Obscuribacterales bacterium]|nr:hypothetical protein [Candidatus Obscuribacterales bacterium]